MMTNAEKLALFATTFKGLSETYGTYDPATGRSWQVKQLVTRQVMLRHLQGIQPYGVYLLQDHITPAAVVDFDDHDANPPLDFLHRVENYGLPAYLERSKSKGYHVWVFFELPGLEASMARALFHHILVEMECPRTEVFPKQNRVSVENGEVGNFINAPLFGALVPEGRTVFLDPNRGLHPYPNQWTVLAGIKRVSRVQLDDVLEINALSPDTSDTIENLGVVRASGGMPPCARHMLEEGVGDFQRVACFRLAVQLRRVGLPYDLAVDVLMSWARKNHPCGGKRIITETEVKAQTAAAFLNEYQGHGCEEPAIAPFCDPACPVHARRVTIQHEAKRHETASV